MGRNRMMSELDMTRAQLGCLTVTIMLASDTFNPVKIFLHVFPQVQPWHIVALCLLLIIYVFVSELKQLLYFGVKVFFHSILSIFFREVEVVGQGNIPPYGPVIFTGNHANQFIDGVTVLTTCKHTISYLVAEASYNRRVIGDLAWALGAVPIKRAQDSAKPGTGVVTLKKVVKSGGDDDAGDGQGEWNVEVVGGAEKMGDEEDEMQVFHVSGTGTIFTSEVREKDKIRVPGSPLGLKIMKIDDDTHMTVEVEAEYVPPSSSDPLKFDILRRIDQKQVYSAVLDKLSRGGCIGIFPEGGSHDRTDLLPLKVGVALIAYSALEKDGLNIPIVPVGLNYFRSHRFRGRAIVEYGTPIYIDPSSVGAFKEGGAARRKVCNELLERIEDSMRSVIVTAPDYQTLQMVYTARRLYQRREYSALEKQDLNRRFAEGYKRLLLHTRGNPPKEWKDLQERILAYQNELADLGIRDYQVPTLGYQKDVPHDVLKGGLDGFDPDQALRDIRVHYRILYLLLVIVLALVPSLLLNFPVGMIARTYSERRRKKALARSKVKIQGLDVVLTERVVLCIVLVPSLWFTYGLLLYFFSGLDGPTIALTVLSMPLFSYWGIMATEAGMVQIKDIRPYIMKLFPSTRKRLNALPHTRVELQRDLRRFIKKVGPVVGEVYYDKELDWKVVQEKSRKQSVPDLQSLGTWSPERKDDGKKDV